MPKFSLCVSAESSNEEEIYRCIVDIRVECGGGVICGGPCGRDVGGDGGGAEWGGVNYTAWEMF